MFEYVNGFYSRTGVFVNFQIFHKLYKKLASHSAFLKPFKQGTRGTLLLDFIILF